MPAEGTAFPFARAWTVLRGNAVIVLPSILVGIASALAARILAHGGYLSWSFFGAMNEQGPGAFWLFAQTIVAMLLRMVAAVVAIALTAGMAATAWSGSRASLADGARALRRRGVQAFFALVLLTLLGLFASALLIPTFGISVLAYMTFFLYAMPAVVVGNRGAIEALVESIALAWRSFGVTFLLTVMIAALAGAGAGAGWLAEQVPFAGHAASWILMEATIAYATVVVVGEYLELARTKGSEQAHANPEMN